MHFKDIITQEGHTDYLQHAVDHQTLPHALLFWGPEGTGKLAAAIALSQYLLCSDRKPDGSCGVCRSCVKTQKLIHPDVHFVFPTTGAKTMSTDLYPEWREALRTNMHMGVHEWVTRISAENKQGNINAGDTHRIIEQLMLKSFESSYKVLIMWMAEYLQKEGNRLLKLIEEPPDNTFIILIAEDRNAILPTVVSRCQQLYFAPLSTQRIRQEAERMLKMDEEKARWIAQAAQGNWNTALQLAQGTYFNPVVAVQDWIKAAWSKDPAVISDWVTTTGRKSREEHKQFLRYLLNIWQKLFWMKWGMPFEAEPDELKLVSFLNTKIELNELEALVHLCEENIQAIERNANARILWFDATMRLRNALHNVRSEVGA